jgi:hypothetical protein
MSWFATHKRWLTAPEARPAAGLRMWHALCMSFGLSGCYFWFPLIEEPQNVPPTITASYPAAGDTWVLEPGLNKAFVLVQDPDAGDPERLEYFWTIGRFGEQGTAVPIAGNEVGSWLHLIADDKYDGNVLSVRVTDPQGGADDISWELSIPEEAP